VGYVIQLVDSSAWIEYLQHRSGGVGDLLESALRDDAAATTDAVVLEVLSGTTDVLRLARWEGLIARCEYLEQVPRFDAEAAAELYRICRRAGETPRSPNDCLVAAVAIRHDVPVLQRDRDFEVLARHTPLRLVST
jgi:predicted nucleic acid-binding protein